MRLCLSKIWLKTHDPLGLSLDFSIEGTCQLDRRHKGRHKWDHRGQEVRLEWD